MLAVEIPCAQQQKGNSDCGVFAIAFAVHATLGDVIEDIEFNQYEMREHIVNCFSNGRFTAFPTDQTTYQAERLNFIAHVESQRHLITWWNVTNVKYGLTYVWELHLLL